MVGFVILFLSWVVFRNTISEIWARWQSPPAYPGAELLDAPISSGGSAFSSNVSVYLTSDNLDTVLKWMEHQMPGFQADARNPQRFTNERCDNGLTGQFITWQVNPSYHFARNPCAFIAIEPYSQDLSQTQITAFISWPDR